MVIFYYSYFLTILYMEDPGLSRFLYMEDPEEDGFL